MMRLTTLLLLVSVVPLSAGQRSITSLATKIKSGRSSDEATTVKDDFVVRNDKVVTAKGLEKVDFAFEDVRVTLKTRQGERQLLDGSIRGRALPGRMLAIMGPSGAGKSVLLHALAGRLPDNPKLACFGRRYVNGEPLASESLLPAAFIEQDVNFFPHMTVRETLDFRVALKLGSQLSKKARDEMVDDLLAQTGLTDAADTIVGNIKVRGVSGGERKRLSIAVELISSPAVIFLDEPTSGLDSTSTTKLIQTLRELADAGKTVVAVIHQPSQNVFAKFDDLLLVSEGRQMYYGEVKKVRSYMERRGYTAIAETGTAEHIIDCISNTILDDEDEDTASARFQFLAHQAADATVDIGPVARSESMALTFSTASRHSPMAGIFRQFGLLFKRSFREIFRGKTVFILKAMQQITTAMIYGGIYSLGSDQSSIQDRFGLLSLIAIGSANLAMASSIRAFPKEKAIVSNELASKMYRTLPYLIGKALSELPVVAILNGLFGGIVYRLTGLSRAAGKFRRFITLLITHGMASEAAGLLVGAISPDSDVALAIFPAILVLNVIFDGKNISEENTPKILRWIPKIGLIRWGFEGFALNEFQDLHFTSSGARRGPPAKTGTEALDRFGLGKRPLSDVFRAQLMITGSCWALSFLGLTLTRSRFLPMQTPSETEPQVVNVK